tara:strand:+ start:10671 stop:11387 length:717 start_codon:yes stop_codon:yes gene_type:complete
MPESRQASADIITAHYNRLFREGKIGQDQMMTVGRMLASNDVPDEQLSEMAYSIQEAASAPEKFQGAGGYSYEPMANGDIRVMGPDGKVTVAQKGTIPHKSISLEMAGKDNLYGDDIEGDAIVDPDALSGEEFLARYGTSREDMDPQSERIAAGNYLMGPDRFAAFQSRTSDAAKKALAPEIDEEDLSQVRFSDAGGTSVPLEEDEEEFAGPMRTDGMGAGRAPPFLARLMGRSRRKS